MSGFVLSRSLFISTTGIIAKEKSSLNGLLWNKLKYKTIFASELQYIYTPNYETPYGAIRICFGFKLIRY